MRTITVSGIALTYPDPLAYVFNTMPVAVELPSGSAEKTIAVLVTSPEIDAEYYELRQTFKGKASIDIRELVKILFEECLRGDTIGLTAFSRAEKITMRVRNYPATAGGGYTDTTEQFELSRFVRQFNVSVHLDDVSGENLLSFGISAIYGRGSYVSDLAVTNVEKLWCGYQEVMQFIIGPNTSVTIPGRLGNVKAEIMPPAGVPTYNAIVLNANFVNYGSAAMPEYIKITNAPRFNVKGELSEGNTNITFHAQCSADVNAPNAFVRFLSPQGEVVTSVLKPTTQVATSTTEETTQRAYAADNVDFGADRNGIARNRQTTAYGLKYRLKYATALLPLQEIKKLREVVGSAYVEVLDYSVTTQTYLRVYPVPGSVEIKASQSLTGFNIEFELPPVNTVGV